VVYFLVPNYNFLESSVRSSGVMTSPGPPEYLVETN
jgi:hypothetical protein